MGRIMTFAMPAWFPSEIYVKRNYIFSFLPQTVCLGKICGPNLDKVGYFSVFFFGFSNITVKILMVEEFFFR